VCRWQPQPFHVGAARAARPVGSLARHQGMIRPSQGRGVCLRAEIHN
jgi:hypothetical protein